MTVQQWERLIKSQREDGWTWAEIREYCLFFTDEILVINTTLRLEKEERTIIALKSVRLPRDCKCHAECDTTVEQRFDRHQRDAIATAINYYLSTH